MFLSEEQIRAVLRMDELIAAMREALRELSAGRVQQPVRVVVPVAEQRGFFGVMPAYASTRGALGAKLVTFFPNNSDVPTHHAIIQLFRHETGEPLVTMDGRLITEMRTAACSAVATDLLARRNVSVLAILGSGVQARSHLEALRIVRNFSDIRVWSPRNAETFAREFNVTAAGTAEQCVRDADVVVVATSAVGPVLLGRWLPRGVHVNAVGATRPNWRELDDDLLRRARIFVEQRDAATKESGDILAAGKIDAEIGELLAGNKPGRQSDDEITLYKSVGVAAEDIFAADLAYRRLTNQQSQYPEDDRQHDDD